MLLSPGISIQGVFFIFVLMAEMQATEVFQWNWSAINEMIEVDGVQERRWRYIRNIGSSRSSKTYSLIDLYDLYARSNKAKRMTVWRDTAKDCKDTVLSDMKKYLQADGRWYTGMSFHETTSVMRYGTKSRIEICGTDEVKKVHGLTQDVAWFNEPYLISRAVFDQIDQRTSDFILIDLNPLMWHWSDDIAKDPRCLTIHSTFANNPFCPPEQKRKILSYQPVSMCEIVLQKKLTEDEANKYDLVVNVLNFPDWAIKELFRCRQNEYQRSASKFNWEVYGLGTKAERPNRIFRWEEVPDSVYHDLSVREYTGSDWGVVHPWAIGSAKYYDGALYVHEHNYESENELRQKMGSTETRQISGHKENEGIIPYIFTKIGIPFNRHVICDNNRPLKIKALRSAGWEYSVGTVKDKNSILDGIQLLTDIPVYYTASSLNIKHEQENYVRDVDSTGAVLEDPKDENNHHMDWIRYVGLWLEKEGVIRRSKK